MRLTRKYSKPLHYDNNEKSHYTAGIMPKCLEKLGQLEDVLEKYKIDTPQELDKDLDMCHRLVYEYGQIEEELGIDLITLFKAIYNGVWAKNSKQGIHFISLIDWNCEVSKIGNQLKPLFTFNVWEGNEEDADDVIYFVKDYGKTWALTKEELL